MEVVVKNKPVIACDPNSLYNLHASSLTKTILQVIIVYG